MSLLLHRGSVKDKVGQGRELAQRGRERKRCVQEGRVPAPTQGKCEGQGRARP